MTAKAETPGMPRDFDGEPCLLGDMVWHPAMGRCAVVAASWKGKVAVRRWENREGGRGAKWVPSASVTHREPDSQERIDADASKPCILYWGCDGAKCSQCPAKIGGKTPEEAYGTDEDCRHAMILDLLRRQRELLEGCES